MDFACGVLGELRKPKMLGHLSGNPMSLLEGDMATPMLKWRKTLNPIMALSDLRRMAHAPRGSRCPRFYIQRKEENSVRYSSPLTVNTWS